MNKAVNSYPVKIFFISKDVKRNKDNETHESGKNMVPADLYCKHADRWHLGWWEIIPDENLRLWRGKNT